MTRLRNARLALLAVLSVAAVPNRLGAVEHEPARPQSVLGACCFVDGSCQLREAADCFNWGGLYQGDGTTCTNGICDGLGRFGACCIWATYTCDIRTPEDCAAAGGAYFGDGSDCSPCMRMDGGACCLPDGRCIGGYPEDCEAAGGVYQGPGSFCEGPCWGGGACCFTDWCYENATQSDCASMGGAFYLEQSCGDVFPGCSAFTGVGEPGAASAISLVVSPNPSRETTSFEFELPQEQQIVLSVYDIAGRRIRLLGQGQFAAGRQAVAWDQRDDSGHDLPAGIYFVRLTSTTGLEVTERITVVR